MNSDSTKILSFFEDFLGCFFELLNEGLISDLEFDKKLADHELPCVSKFQEDDYSAVSTALEGVDNAVLLQGVVIVIEKLNVYLNEIGVGKIVSIFSNFDESVSSDDFFRVTKKIPQEEKNLHNWLHSIWGFAFQRVASFEINTSYANLLHNESSNAVAEAAEQNQTIQIELEKANNALSMLNLQLYGDEEHPGLKEKMQDAVETVKNQVHSSTVTILGIFATIVLSFSGVFSFSSSIMENLNKGSIYRLVGVSALVGFIAFNLIFCLIIFLLRMPGTIEKKALFEFPLLPYWITNIVLFLVFVFSIVAWRFDWLTKSSDSNFSSGINGTTYVASASTSGEQTDTDIDELTSSDEPVT